MMIFVRNEQTMRNPFPFQSERRTDEDSALARLGGATTYPIEMEME